MELDEIAVTPEMVRAGWDALTNYEEYMRESDMALIAVYRVMEAERLRQRKSAEFVGADCIDLEIHDLEPPK